MRTYRCAIRKLLPMCCVVLCANCILAQSHMAHWKISLADDETKDSSQVHLINVEKWQEIRRAQHSDISSSTPSALILIVGADALENSSSSPNGVFNGANSDVSVKKSWPAEAAEEEEEIAENENESHPELNSSVVNSASHTVGPASNAAIAASNTIVPMPNTGVHESSTVAATALNTIFPVFGTVTTTPEAATWGSTYVPPSLRSIKLAPNATTPSPPQPIAPFVFSPGAQPLATSPVAPPFGFPFTIPVLFTTTPPPTTTTVTTSTVAHDNSSSTAAMDVTTLAPMPPSLPPLDLKSIPSLLQMAKLIPAMVRSFGGGGGGANAEAIPTLAPGPGSPFGGALGTGQGSLYQMLTGQTLGAAAGDALPTSSVMLNSGAEYGAGLALPSAAAAHAVPIQSAFNALPRSQFESILANGDSDLGDAEQGHHVDQGQVRGLNVEDQSPLPAIQNHRRLGPLGGTKLFSVKEFAGSQDQSSSGIRAGNREEGLIQPAAEFNRQSPPHAANSPRHNGFEYFPHNSVTDAPSTDGSASMERGVHVATPTEAPPRLTLPRQRFANARGETAKNGARRSEAVSRHNRLSLYNLKTVADDGAAADGDDSVLSKASDEDTRQIDRGWTHGDAGRRRFVEGKAEKSTISPYVAPMREMLWQSAAPTGAARRERPRFNMSEESGGAADVAALESVHREIFKSKAADTARWSAEGFSNSDNVDAQESEYSTRARGKYRPEDRPSAGEGGEHSANAATRRDEGDYPIIGSQRRNPHATSLVENDGGDADDRRRREQRPPQLARWRERIIAPETESSRREAPAAAAYEEARKSVKVANNMTKFVESDESELQYGKNLANGRQFQEEISDNWQQQPAKRGEQQQQQLSQFIRDQLANPGHHHHDAANVLGDLMAIKDLPELGELTRGLDLRLLGRAGGYATLRQQFVQRLLQRNAALRTQQQQQQ